MFKQENIAVMDKSPERMMLVGILQKAYADLKCNETVATLCDGRARVGRSKKISEATIEWFRSPELSSFEHFTFLHVCESLDLDPKFLRKKAEDVYRKEGKQ